MKQKEIVAGISFSQADKILLDAINEARGHIPLSKAMRIILRHLYTADPRYFHLILGTTPPLPMPIVTSNIELPKS